jgi:hypothetical protein
MWYILKDFHPKTIFKPMIEEVLNFEWFKLLEINLKI